MRLAAHAPWLLCISAAWAGACGGETAAPQDEDVDAEAFSGGTATVFDASRMAFALPIPGLDAADEDEFFVGNSIFNRGWVAAPASVEQFDGVGPLFNAVSCSGCHFKDGRGAPPEVEGEAFSALLLRLSVPGADEHGGPLPEPTYGGQVQGQAVRGVPAEARESVVYEEEAGTYGDGERYTLRRPRYAIAGAFGPLAPEVLVSPRVAPAMHGLGLLEAVPDAALEALADPDDRDGDGISGRVNRVWDVESKSTRVGRFGWKANQPSLRQQTAGAFVGDMGLTSSLFPEEECTPAQLACLAAPSGGAPELSESLLGSVVTYSRLLAVPARRKWKDATVLRGKALFAEARCTACHTPLLRTASDATPSRLAGVTLRPYTDLLLHDLGPDLADGRPDFEATGQEWRTPPLWGIGLVATVNRHTFLLHDGRARGFAEAILWHGGEAEPSRNAFRSMPKADRDALLAFLQSL